MDISKFKTQLAKPSFSGITEPSRKIKLSPGDEVTVYKAIQYLNQSKIRKRDVFKIFNDWQTQKTLTSKRIFVSSSLLVSAAAFIGVDYTELSLFGLKVSNGSPLKFLIFILISIVVSGVFYEVSRRIDISVRNAQVANIEKSILLLKEHVESLIRVMDKNEISSFKKLYNDFKPNNLLSPTVHDETESFDTVKFYQTHLVTAGKGLNVVVVAEQVIIYLIAINAIFALLISIWLLILKTS